MKDEEEEEEPESLAGIYRSKERLRALSRASVKRMARILETSRRVAPLATLDHEQSRCSLPKRRVLLIMEALTVWSRSRDAECAWQVSRTIGHEERRDEREIR